MPQSLADRFQLRAESFVHGAFVVELLLPASSDALLDEAAFQADERLPYWAELWPSARALARALLELRTVPPRALELGCGVGLPSLALRSRGVDVLATDYEPDALLFAHANAARNGLGPLRTALLDWRRPDPGKAEYPLVIAADVLYEARNVAALVQLLPTILEPSGSLLLADPGRLHLTHLCERLLAAGWQIEDIGTRYEPSPAGGSRIVRVSLLQISRRAPGSAPGAAPGVL